MKLRLIFRNGKSVTFNSRRELVLCCQSTCLHFSCPVLKSIKLVAVTPQGFEVPYLPDVDNLYLFMVLNNIL